MKDFKEPVVQPIIEKDVIKEKITDFFNRKKPAYSHSLVPSNISQEYHESLLTDILNDILIEIDNDFYTSSYKFSKKDFIDGDYNEEQEKGTNILKIIFLLIAIFALIVGIYYFISKFGMGA